MTGVTSVDWLKMPSPEVARPLLGRLDRVVEHLGAVDPVQPEQPRRLGAVAPGVEVEVPARR